MNSSISADFVAKKEADQKIDGILYGMLYSKPTTGIK